MVISVYPITPSFATEVGDLDLAQPLDPADLAELKAAFATYAVLIFPDQQLTQEQHLAFAAVFGPLELTIGVYRKDAPLRVRKEFAVEAYHRRRRLLARIFAVLSGAGQVMMGYPVRGFIFMAATASEVLRRQVDSFTKQVTEIPADRPARA